MHRSIKIILFFAVILFAGPAFADAPRLGWPLACKQGENCWVVHHVDVDSDKDVTRDYQCGHLTYDGHDGTDIAIRDLKSMTEGIAVLSAEAGTVLGGRSHVADGHGTVDEIAAVKKIGQECGNGVLIEHQGGWQTQYCHLKQDSIVVKKGQHVEKGAFIGMVGQSGMTQFPHLHFAVRHDGVDIDPFSGAAASAGCRVGQTAGALWDAPLAYDPAMFYAAGFSAKSPVYDELLANAEAVELLPVSSPSLVFWFMLYGAQKDDQLNFNITDPSGAIFAKSNATQEKDQIRIFRFIGKNAKLPLQAGTYTGRATLTRSIEGKAPLVRVVERRVTVE